MVDPHIFLIVALILLSTKALAIVMRRIRLPKVVGALVAGVLLGPSVFNLVQPNETISIIAEFGVIFLLFSAGMETDLKQLRDSFKASMLISVLGVVAGLGGGFIVAYAFGWSLFESFFIGVIIASMSTSITVEALQELGKLRTKSGTAILAASLFDDILVIVILAVVMGLGVGEVNFATVSIIMIKIVVFFVFAVLSGLAVNKLFNFMYDKFGNKGRLSVYAIAYCLLMAYFAEFFGLADITGAFIAGIAFCNTRCVDYLETNTHVLSYILFTPIFLANIGIHTMFSGLTGSMILFAILLTVASILSKVVGCGLGAKISNYTNKESMQVGAGMIARGEISFIVASKGIAVGFISSLIFPSVIVVVLVTALITPLLLKAAYASETSEASNASNVS